MWRDFKEELSIESSTIVLSQPEDILTGILPLKNSIPVNELTVLDQSDKKQEEAILKQPNSTKKKQKSRNKIAEVEVNKLPTEILKDSVKCESQTNSDVAEKKERLNVASQQGKQSKIPISSKMAASMFDMDAAMARKAPEMPSTDGVTYPRAASWASESLANVLKDEKGRELFRFFLHSSLAEENLLFIESYEKFKQMSDPTDKKQYIEEFFAKYSPYVNLSSMAMQKIKEAASADDPNPSAFALAVKEVNRLLENDQFPRFKRSEIYVDFLEKLLPRSYAERWTTSFEALLGNQIGRHYFRRFLQNIHAEENLRFWEAVIEFKQTKNQSVAMLNMARNIQKQYLLEGTHNEIFLPFGVRRLIEKRINDKEVDSTLFDEAVKHAEQVLKNDPYIRFLQSNDYNDLLAKLK